MKLTRFVKIYTVYNNKNTPAFKIKKITTVSAQGPDMEQQSRSPRSVASLYLHNPPLYLDMMVILAGDIPQTLADLSPNNPIRRRLRPRVIKGA